MKSNLLALVLFGGNLHASTACISNLMQRFSLDGYHYSLGNQTPSQLAPARQAFLSLANTLRNSNATCSVEQPVSTVTTLACNLKFPQQTAAANLETLQTRLAQLNQDLQAPNLSQPVLIGYGSYPEQALALLKNIGPRPTFELPPQPSLEPVPNQTAMEFPLLSRREWYKRVGMAAGIMGTGALLTEGTIRKGIQKPIVHWSYLHQQYDIRQWIMKVYKNEKDPTSIKQKVNNFRAAGDPAAALNLLALYQKHRITLGFPSQILENYSAKLQEKIKHLNNNLGEFPKTWEHLRYKSVSKENLIVDLLNLDWELQRELVRFLVEEKKLPPDRADLYFSEALFKQVYEIQFNSGQAAPPDVFPFKFGEYDLVLTRAHQNPSQLANQNYGRVGAYAGSAALALIADKMLRSGIRNADIDRILSEGHRIALINQGRNNEFEKEKEARYFSALINTPLPTELQAAATLRENLVNYMQNGVSLDREVNYFGISTPTADLDLVVFYIPGNSPYFQTAWVVRPR